MKHILILLVLMLAGCSVTNNPSSDATQAAMSQQIFSDSITDFKVNVFYEVGADPYVGNIGLTTNSTWSITESSYQALFQTHTGRTVTVPKILSNMTSIADQAKTSWTSNDLITLGSSLAPALNQSNHINVSVVFVNGTYMGNNAILGVHFTGYGFAFIFKDVVTSVGGTGSDQRYVEQGTVVHELGHVVGFTNNGVPMLTNYEDTAHPKHSTNSSDVMYWAVESTTSVLSSLNSFILGNQLNLFGTETLNDGRSYHP